MKQMGGTFEDFNQEMDEDEWEELKEYFSQFLKESPNFSILEKIISLREY